MPKGPKEWSPRPADRRAAEFEEAVRQAFVDVYGPPQDLGYVEQAIRSSYLPPGEKLGWTEPNPDVVLVLTEYGWVHDHYSWKEDYEKWGQAMNLLHERGWKKAWWESVNAAVQTVLAS